MWRVKYYHWGELIDISFNIASKGEAQSYAKVHAKELECEAIVGGEVTYIISKDK